MEGQLTADNRQQTLSTLRCSDMMSLKSLNTMGFDVVAKHYYEINSLNDIKELIDNNIFKNNKTLILGGGSNILFTDEYFDGVVIHSNLKGISFVESQQTTDNSQQTLDLKNNLYLWRQSLPPRRNSVKKL